MSGPDGARSAPALRAGSRRLDAVRYVLLRVALVLATGALGACIPIGGRGSSM